ncbi:MAG: hypothetical protein MK078_01750 [Crocinitomicaceae bacterium]|nr:hypothetical protein [Crocinitomicaceae bacterium]
MINKGKRTYRLSALNIGTRRESRASSRARVLSRSESSTCACTPNKNADKKYRISAFTMMDVLTGMVIMSIIIGMVYYLFTSVNYQLIQYTKNKSELYQHLSLQSELNWSTANAKEIIRTPKGFDFTFAESPTISIEENGSQLLRKYERFTDTLTTTLNEIEYQLYVDSEGHTTDLIQRITIESQVTEVPLSFELEKQYENAEFINKTLINEH